MGHRVEKSVIFAKQPEKNYTEYFMRDAQGNIMAIYRKTASEETKLQEHIIYGSSRIGIVSMSNIDSEDNLSVERGNKQYELSNHLGNVLATITDRKLRTKSDTVSYVADVSSASDYYPFGMNIGSRSFSGYRWGFQGQEAENELFGEGNASFFTYRISDNRLGRFFAVDPLAPQFPWNSSYAFSENRLLDGIELEGLEWQPIDDKGNNVAVGADNIADYKWVGYDEMWSPGKTKGEMGSLTFTPKPGTVSEASLTQTKYSTTNRGKSDIPFITATEGATFYSVSNFQPTKEWSRFVDNSLLFTGKDVLTTTDGNVVGNNYGHRSEGSLQYLSNYANGKSIIENSWSANSGQWYNGPMENGLYTVDNIRDNRTGAYANNGVGFSFDVNPLFETCRIYLRIHPDGSPIGTAGCIGLTGDATQLSNARTVINNYIINHNLINLRVNITNNPNNSNCP